MNLEFIRVVLRYRLLSLKQIQISSGSCRLRAARHEARESFLPGKTCCILSEPPTHHCIRVSGHQRAPETTRAVTFNCQAPVLV